MTPNGRITRALLHRRGGELIQAIPRAQGKNGEGLRTTLVRSEIAQTVAVRWQSLLRLEEAQIRGLVATRTEAKQPIRLSYLYALARIRRREAICSSRINRSTRARASARRRNLKRSFSPTGNFSRERDFFGRPTFPFPRSSPRRISDTRRPASSSNRWARSLTDVTHRRM